MCLLPALLLSDTPLYFTVGYLVPNLPCAEFGVEGIDLYIVGHISPLGDSTLSPLLVPNVNPCCKESSDLCEVFVACAFSFKLLGALLLYTEV